MGYRRYSAASSVDSDDNLWVIGGLQVNLLKAHGDTLVIVFDLCFRSGSVEVKAVGVSSPPVDTAQHQTAAAKQKQKPKGPPPPKKEPVKEETKRAENIRKVL